jgi:uncharacterized membrane protein YeaQ/YmgE (transglycosylase-associated protein family)
MSILAWILMGLLAGVVAKWLMPGKGPGGWIWTILLGVAGALVGGFIGTHLLDWGSVDRFDARSIALAIGGSVLLLFVYDRFLRK